MRTAGSRKRLGLEATQAHSVSEMHYTLCTTQSQAKSFEIDDIYKRIDLFL